MRRAAGPLSFALFLSIAALAVPAEKERSLPTTSFGVSTERVKVDVVVRDKKDAILRGLTAADLEVYEDGVRQTVDSFDFVERSGLEPAGALASTPAGALASTPADATPPAFVAVAFDRLSPAARSFAQQAALGYLDRALPARSWMGVFSIDRGLSTLTPFTDDRDGMRKVSLRATDGRVDVSRIAREFGGGGHPQAAGFSTGLPFPELVDQLRGHVREQLATE